MFVNSGGGLRKVSKALQHFLMDGFPGWLCWCWDQTNVKSSAQVSSVGVRLSSVLGRCVAFCWLFCSKTLDLRHFYRESQHTHFEDKMLDQISLWRLPPSWVSLVQNLLERGASSFIGAWILLVQHLLRNGAISYWCQNLIKFTKPTLFIGASFLLVLNLLENDAISCWC